MPLRPAGTEIGNVYVADPPSVPAAPAAVPTVASLPGSSLDKDVTLASGTVGVGATLTVTSADVNSSGPVDEPPECNSYRTSAPTVSTSVTWALLLRANGVVDRTRVLKSYR